MRPSASGGSRGAGLVMSTLRSTDEVRPAEFGTLDRRPIALGGSFEFRMGDVAPSERLGASAWYESQPIGPLVAIVAGDAWPL